MKKGLFEGILIIFLVMVIVITILFYIFFQGTVFISHQKINSKIRYYDLSEHLLRMIYNCYDYPINKDLVFKERCDFSFNKGTQSVKGFDLTILNKGFCSNEELISYPVKDYNDILEYLVPINTGNRNCLASLKVYT